MQAYGGGGKIEGKNYGDYKTGERKKNHWERETGKSKTT